MMYGKIPKNTACIEDAGVFLDIYLLMEKCIIYLTKARLRMSFNCLLLCMRVFTKQNGVKQVLS